MEYHTIEPFYNKNSRLLILGSFPSVKSREVGFYYAHPQNRFWKVLKTVYNEEIDDKKEFLLKHHIALYDVCNACEIKGSSDASIRKVIPNNIDKIIEETMIKVIILNGKTAANLYKKYFKNVRIKTFELPSTSAANAHFSLDMLVEKYSIVKKFTK